ncbi:MAG: hypothetical protein EKK55_19290 [Rhodocyclaceae bacterium]|nr:MAG: hypothetical protein EKK55_19290 [Rhodocyclaceae bacterium]
MKPEPRVIHPAVAAVFADFDFRHLPPHLQEVSRPFAALADRLVDTLSGADLTVALRQLCEAKDTAVRCAVKAAKAENPMDICHAIKAALG